MLVNYIKIALKNIARHKTYAAINIAALAVGIIGCPLLFTVVRQELGCDTFQPMYKRIFRTVSKDKYAGGIDVTSGIPFPALDALRATFVNSQKEPGAAFNKKF